ncbi:MAG: MlaD family protein [Myxococcota bacterium]|jgi:phospholipid/cholesterol/gamma-HCH transport system substrate-binding protein|nr:MlaD family protein [Myxococcota bacterium]
MEDSRRLSLIVGGFFIATLVALAIAVLSLTSESGLFPNQYRIYGHFDNVQGLLPGAPVWMAGKEVGRVEAVEFTEFGSGQPILITMRVNRGVQNRVRTDSVASIGTIGVLGDSYIEIQPGSPDGSVLIDGEEIVTLSPTNLYAVLAQGTEALGAVSNLATNLNAVVSDVREEGVITKAASAVDAASGIILEVQDGSGLLHSLLYDEAEGSGVASIEGSLASLEAILKEVETGDGMLHSLIYGDPNGDGADLNDAIASISGILDQVENGEGLLHALIYDADTGKLSDDAISAVAHLNEILARIDNADGTLGLLVSDPKLYEDMTILLGGAQRSTLLRTLVKLARDD